MKKKLSKTCRLEIGYQGIKVKTRALIDSGNLLIESNSGLPVIIVEKQILNCFDGRKIEKILIPFSSLGNKNGLLKGFKPDYIKLYTDEELFEKKAIIGIYSDSLGGGSEYHAIVGL